MVWNKVVVYSIITKYMDNIVLWINFVIFERFLRNVFCQMVSKNTLLQLETSHSSNNTLTFPLIMPMPQVACEEMRNSQIWVIHMILSFITIIPYIILKDNSVTLLLIVIMPQAIGPVRKYISLLLWAFLNSKIY